MKAYVAAASVSVPLFAVLLAYFAQRDHLPLLASSSPASPISITKLNAQFELGRRDVLFPVADRISVLPAVTGSILSGSHAVLGSNFTLEPATVNLELKLFTGSTFDIDVCLTIRDDHARAITSLIHPLERYDECGNDGAGRKLLLLSAAPTISVLSYAHPPGARLSIDITGVRERVKTEKYDFELRLSAAPLDPAGILLSGLGIGHPFWVAWPTATALKPST